VHASLRDWGKFLRLHLTGSWGSLYLQPATLTRLQTEYTTNPLWPQRYGWGWGIFDEFGGQAMGHDGSNNSWYCSVAVYPEEGFALLAVSNIGGGMNGNGDLAAWDVITLLKARATEVAGAPPVKRECDDPSIIQVSDTTTISASAQPGFAEGLAEFFATTQTTAAELNDARHQIRECSETLSDTEATLQVCEERVERYRFSRSRGRGTTRGRPRARAAAQAEESR
jgi:CubicO group peptidase (beta-lactamase class C family)